MWLARPILHREAGEPDRVQHSKKAWLARHHPHQPLLQLAIDVGWSGVSAGTLRIGSCQLRGQKAPSLICSGLSRVFVEEEGTGTVRHAWSTNQQTLCTTHSTESCAVCNVLGMCKHHPCRVSHEPEQRAVYGVLQLKAGPEWIWISCKADLPSNGKILLA